MKAAWNLNSNQTVPENRYVPCSTLLTNLNSNSLLFKLHSYDASVCAAGDSTKGVHLPEFPQYLLKFLFAYQIPLCKTKRGGLEDTYRDDILAPVLKVWFSKSVDGMVMTTAFYAGFPRMSRSREIAFFNNVYRLQAVADVAAAIKPGFYDIGIGAALLLLDPTFSMWLDLVNCVVSKH
ncbi:hypothetical protein Tco_0739962 [Tanacetum coccineum]